MTRTETWADLFARGEEYEASESAVSAALARRRARTDEAREGTGDDGGETDA